MSEHKSEWLVTPDTRIYYEQTAGRGEPVVCIPGFTLDLRMWDDQVAYLYGAHEVVAYNPRGFGSSSTPNGPYSHEDDMAVPRW